MAYEERWALKHLPAAAARRLLADHARLRRRSTPQALAAHAKREHALYARYVPKAVLRRIEAQHRALDLKDT